MRIDAGRIFELLPRLFGEFLPGLFVDFFRWLFRWKRHERYHFVTDEVVLQITHQTSATQAGILAAVQSLLTFNGNFLQEVYVSLILASGNDWRNRLKPPAQDSRIITIPAPEPFSLVPVRLAWHSRSGLRSAAVGKVLRVAYAQLQNGPLDLGNGISLRSISPDWFAKNLHHGGPTGGPGSWPLEAVAPRPAGTGTPPLSISEHEFRLAGPMDSLQPHKKWAANDPVHVAILDTAPSNSLGQTAQGVIQRLPAAATGSALIQYLFGAGLDIRRYSNRTNPNELTDLARYTPPPDHYEMPDHGTFVAGIIHTIAPSATLHLYEVLNSFGLGTLISMSQSLIDAVNNHYKGGETPLIINCSFMLDLITQDGVSNLDRELDLADPIIAGLLTESARGVFTWATSLKNIVVVAAAGNDAKPRMRPYASFPAAFQGVLGVGALPADYPRYPSGRYIPASYSNFSYDPQYKLPGEGFVTFGGELDRPLPRNGAPISNRGVLGVYIGNLLGRNSANMSNVQLIPSNEGWGRWAGTSFAAPIITGLLAARPGDASISTAAPAPGVPPLTTEGENVIIVQQG